MTVLTIASSKGGPGKTTVAEIIASSAAGRLRLVVLDADPTQAFTRWATNTYEGAPFETHAEPDETRLAHLIAAKADEADLVLVDTAGFGNRAASVAMTSADGVLIPAGAGEADITEAEKTVRLVEGLARAARRQIPARVLFNRVKRSSLSRHAAAEIAAAGLPRLTAELADRVTYGELGFNGRLPTSGPAVAEIEALLAELQALGWLPSRKHVTTSRRKVVKA
jgi:chromosome partitioning protein